MAQEKQKLTPMMQQYCEVKESVNEDTLLLFRMGDFYETFFEDAEKAASVLGITLTKRANIPMAGIPYHSLNNYLPKLLKKGIKVAIAEQVENPRDAQGLVKREITQIITPGTIIDDATLLSEQPNYIVALENIKSTSYGLSFLDLSTGKFSVMEVQSHNELENEICRLNPAEILCSYKLSNKWKDEGVKLDTKATITLIDNDLFNEKDAYRKLKLHFKVATLDGFGCHTLSPKAIVTASVLLEYISTTLFRDISHTKSLEVVNQHNFLTLDRISQRNLEIVEPIYQNSPKSTLVSVLNECVCPMGGRLIREWLLRPLIDKEAIDNRLDAVESFYNEQYYLTELRDLLGFVKDIERFLTRISTGSANAREIVSLKNALQVLPNIKASLRMFSSTHLIKEIIDGLYEFQTICQQLEDALVEEPPITIKDGGFVREGYNAQLDDLRKGALKGKEWLLNFEEKERVKTGIKSLKVRFNKVFGYYIEVTKSNLSLIPDNYIRKQTLVNNERFITPEIKEIENNILGAEDKIKALEYEIFQQLRQQIIDLTSEIQVSAKHLASLDVLSNFAYVSLKYSYRRPVINNDDMIDIQDGKHPVIDVMLEDNSFVANSTVLDRENYIHIITGPNMAGKSTYIRQVALLTVMSQVGCFIPCKEATIGIRHSIFTRIGAADDLSQGQSTFMVEMVETANILNNADSKSLIILDEVGRGTSTFDGLSIAWAIVEYIEKTKALTLFATHYHELTELAKFFTGIKNFNVAVREWNEQVIFLHNIIEGCADKSYGIYVARLAGLPESVITRSKKVLAHLENSSSRKNKSSLSPKGKISDQMELF